jgi:EmrB/QacA subfamily drug resistance transporter
MRASGIRRPRPRRSLRDCDRVSRQERLTLIATILGSTVAFLDSTVVNVALPAIQDDLDTGLAGQQWVVEAYMLALVSLMLVGGSLGDLYGRKRLFEIGLAGFGVTSILCAIAPTDEALIGFRALQGAAGALLVPGSLAILAATFEGEARGRAVGLWTAWSGISTLVGPAGGGLLVELDWRWIFWVNVPLIAGTLWLTRRFVKESSDPEAHHGVDFVGIGLSAIGLGGPVFALIEQPTKGWGDPAVAIPLIVGVVSFAAFIWWERRARAPMLQLELFRIRNFSMVNLATFCVYAGLIGSFFFLTLYLQQVAGYSPFEAGLATTPTTVMLFLLSGRFGALSARIGPRIPLTVGPIVGASGILLLVRLNQDVAYFVDVFPAMLLFGLGLSITVAPLTTTVLNSVSERHAGVASGVNNAVARVAGLIAIAALGAVISAQFASTLDDRLSQDTSAQAARIVDEAKEQPLAGGDTSTLPAGEGRELERDIVASSESAFHLGIGIAAGLMILGGLIALAGVRNPERAPRPELEHAPGPAATVGECGRSSHPSEPGPVPGTLEPEPAGAGGDPLL